MAKGRGHNAGFRGGDNWVICDVCGIAHRSSVMRTRWDGAIVCPEDFELRHPQDYVRAREDIIAVEGPVRPEETAGEETFVTKQCTTRSAEAGEAIAGCAIAGMVTANVPSGTFSGSGL